MLEERAKPPTSKERTAAPLLELDYTAESKAMLCSTGPAEQEWFEVELTADTGACDTVIPISMCQEIPVQPSLQSQRGMQYEVANGVQIPNLGERQFTGITEYGTMKSVVAQVCDVNRGLLSVRKVTRAGNRVVFVFDDAGSYIWEYGNMCK